MVVDYTLTPIMKHGQELYALKAIHHKHTIEVHVNPQDGMNICYIGYDDFPIVQWNLERYQKGATYGIPILFPTPNRVKDGTFTFEGSTYPMHLNGKPLLMHGIARKSAFDVLTLGTNDSSAYIVAALSIEEGSPLYEAFPFACELKVTITLQADRLHIAFGLENRSSKRLPYGLALHPFFTKYKETYIQTTADGVMAMTDNKLPTGQVMDVAGTAYDLRHLTPVDDLVLDHVYTTCEDAILASIWYKDRDLNIHLHSSDVFKHLVVFVPEDKDFFCIENQSCSTNAHNLYNQGYEQVSGLQILEPGKSNEGHVTFIFEEQN